MLSTRLDQTVDAEGPISRWKGVYRAGGAAALVGAVFIPIQIIVFIMWPPPSTVIGYFTVFQNNRLLGLLDLDLLLIVQNALGVVVILALYIALKRTGESIMAVAVLLGLVGAAAYFAANPAFSMLFLSDQYAAATTEAQKAMCLAAGQAMLAMYNGTAFHANYILGTIALFIISMVMLRSNTFSKATAYVGIVANILAFGLYVPAIGIYVSIISVLFLWIWYLLIARRLFQLE